MESFLDSCKKLIDKAEIISFDIFDTLLLRSFLEPIDVFCTLEKNENRENFASFRINAEPMAMQKLVTSQKDDVTFDEIYSEMPVEFQDMKEKEINFEENHLFLNPEMYDVFKYAETSGKKIIICSDMYLPEDILKKILVKKLKTDNFSLYVSSKYGCRKSTGRLFNYILSDLGVSSGQVLHIGDNETSDYKVPLSLGIKAVYYPKPIYSFLEDEHIKLFYGYYFESLSGRTFLAILSLLYQYYKESDYWKKFAFLYGGPLVYTYAQFIIQSAKDDNLTDLAFVARDGYTLKKVFDLLNTDKKIKSHYVYAPRFTNLLAYLDFGSLYYVIQSRMEALAEFLKENGLPINDPTEVYLYPNELEKYSEKERLEYTNYLESLHLGQKVGVVDSISHSYSAEKLISKTLKQEVEGLYWWTLKSNKSENVQKKEYYTGKYIPNFSDIIEFLMSAPEKPIRRVLDLKPVYKNPISEYEQIKIDLYPTISNTIIEFSKLIKKLNINLDIDDQMMFVWMSSFVLKADQNDFNKFENIKNGIDQGHNIYEPVLKKLN